MVSMSAMIHRHQTHQKSLCQHPCYCCQVPKFLQNLSFLLPQIFFPPYTIAIASSVWWNSFFAVFAFSNWSMFLMWSMFTYNLTELHLIPKMLTTMLINWAVNLWHPYCENSLGWLHTRHRAVNQEVNFYFQRKGKTVISPPIFSLYQKFFSEITEISWAERMHSNMNILKCQMYLALLR